MPQQLTAQRRAFSRTAWDGGQMAERGAVCIVRTYAMGEPFCGAAWEMAQVLTPAADEESLDYGPYE